MVLPASDPRARCVERTAGSATIACWAATLPVPFTKQLPQRGADMLRTTVLLGASLAVPWATARAQQPRLVRVPAAVKSSPGARVLRSGGTTHLPAGDVVALKPGEFVAARSPGVSVGRRSGDTIPDRFVLPLRLVGVDSAGGVLDAQPTVTIEGGGLTYTAAERAFTGSIFVGLEEPGAAPVRALGRQVLLLVTASDARADPPQVSLDHTSLPYKHVRLTSASPAGDTIVLHIRTTFDPNPVNVPVPVLRSSLSVSVTPRRINGFGLEATTVGVRAEPVLPRASVLLTASKGSIDPAVVQLDSSGITTASLRSAGTGLDTVEAKGQSLRSASATVAYVFPWAFLVAAIVGGLVGGLVRELLVVTGTKEGVRFGRFVLGWVAFILIGIVVVVAWAVGIDLLGIRLSAVYGEGLVAVIAALPGLQPLFRFKGGALGPPAEPGG